MIVPSSEWGKRPAEKAHDIDGESTCALAQFLWRHAGKGARTRPFENSEDYARS